MERRSNIHCGCLEFWNLAETSNSLSLNYSGFLLETSGILGAPILFHSSTPPRFPEKKTVEAPDDHVLILLAEAAEHQMVAHSDLVWQPGR